MNTGIRGNNLRALISIIILLFASGCASTGAIFPGHIAPKEGKAVVYLYRPSTLVNSAQVPNIYVNGKRYRKLLVGGYQRHELPPGEHLIVADGNAFQWAMGPRRVYVNLKENEVAYIQLGSNLIDFRVQSGLVSTSSETELFQVDNKIGGLDIRRARLSQ